MSDTDVTATWIGPYEAALPTGAVLVPGESTAQIPRVEAERSTNWQMVETSAQRKAREKTEKADREKREKAEQAERDEAAAQAEKEAGAEAEQLVEEAAAQAREQVAAEQAQREGDG